MAEVQTETPVQVTPPPTFGDLEAKSKAAAAAEANPPPKPNPVIEQATQPKPPAEEKVESKEKPVAEKTAEEIAAEKAAAEKNPDPKEQGKEGKPVVPEKYELKLSANSPLSQPLLDRIAASAKAQGLSQEQAEGLVKTQEADVGAFIEEQKIKWRADTIADKEIGGEALKENLALANDMIERFATPAMKAELTRTGYGNHPEMVRMFVKIGKASANDKAIIPRTTQTAVKSVADIMYDKTKNP